MSNAGVASTITCVNNNSFWCYIFESVYNQRILYSMEITVLLFTDINQFEVKLLNESVIEQYLVY